MAKKKRTKRGVTQREQLELDTALAKKEGDIDMPFIRGGRILTQEKLAREEGRKLEIAGEEKKETIKELQTGAEQLLEDVGSQTKRGNTLTDAELELIPRNERPLMINPLTGKEMLSPQLTTEESRLFGAENIQATLSSFGAFGGGAGSAGKIASARASLVNLNKWEGIKLFGMSIKLKEMVVGAAVFSQTVARKLIKNMDADATKLGTERNEKIARYMISGLHPDLAIEMYQQDKDYLMAGRESVQLYRIGYLWDYITGDVDTTQINIQNQIEAKNSRIAEAEKFKLGITTLELQRMIMETEGAEDEL